MKKIIASQALYRDTYFVSYYKNLMFLLKTKFALFLVKYRKTGNRPKTDLAV